LRRALTHGRTATAPLALAALVMAALPLAATRSAAQAPAPAPAQAEARPDFSGLWMLEPGGPKDTKSFPADLPEGWRTFGSVNRPAPPLTKEAYEQVRAQRVKENSATDIHGGLDDETAHCRVAGFPDFISFDVPLDIMQRPDELLMVTERERQLPRHIWIVPEHPLIEDYSPARSGMLYRNGHSIAHWEGRTLVIKTDSFETGPWMFSIERVPHSDRMTTVERLDLSADGSTLTDVLEITDPKVLTRPWTLKYVWKRAKPGTEALESNCEIDAEYLGIKTP
jgi:hypothetical protein